MVAKMYFWGVVLRFVRFIFLSAFGTLMLMADLVLDSPAEAATVKRIEVRGNVYVNKNFVLAQLPLKVGGNYSTVDINEAVKKTF